MEFLSEVDPCGTGTSRRAFLAGSAALAGSTVLPAVGQELAQEPAQSGRAGLAHSSTGMVTSPHGLASQAGLEVLKAGGNAIEAAIAIGAVLSVTYPHFTGLGGDAFLVVSDRGGNVRTFSGIGQAASETSGYAGTIPLRGPAAALTAAATVAIWDRAFAFSRDQWGGTQSWSALLARATEYAANGFPVTPSQCFWQEFRSAELSGWDGFGQVFMPDGRMPRPGEMFRQPELARTLDRVATQGGREFYEGDLAGRLAAGLARAGSPLREQDLARCQAREEVPLRVAYRDGELLGLRPPTQGVTTLEIMGILDRFDLSGIPEGSADYYHLLVEAVKLAFLDRNRYVADPDFVDVPLDRLLSRSNLDAHARRIRMDRAMAWPHMFKPGDTVYIGAADREGRCVSMLQTVYFDWGSGLVVGDTGLLWHNRGASFSLDPASPNVLRGGKRPFHTLNPGIYLKQGRPHLLYGTQGADGQPQTLAAVLTRMIDYGMDPLTALRRPRFLLGKTFSDSRDSLKLEQDAGMPVFSELAARGHQLSPIPAQSQLAGHPGAIRIDAGGQLSGAHDPRSDGRALGI
ncbi:gamma-glutamyltransferase family protein [Cupriavidus necator]|uniref:Gamma-glutamyltransferase family protein n=1 Tax=Cupriavidus necator TaxID=106590 RepID=A0A367PKL7_CUPNE|nr:gamma-glutamyltransferase family protein [Cupriavidus necator]QQX85139.1 gamma-glutamyltransferase family protein [Cupriavidus necator]RCJ08054.1 gamma-glutamyltransferase family protein [Cupriavidus necator]